MGKAARAIIVENNKILVMYRNKQGEQYYTLVGGRCEADEPPEKALVREIKEETGLDVVAASLVFYEDHPSPYNQQYIYICRIGPHEETAIQTSSEEYTMNKMGLNIHKPLWVPTGVFEKLPFRTPQLQAAIVKSLKHDWPRQAVKL